ncbi:hypothetical protein HG535_0A06540 [Zygotorulaspora mrakii]|uniref:Uncharacterized protein n=1 Tax=Zygotorulaspora mrakii TaxID=42260 RepID=A0A7H9AYR3_ZYGMR|nr:uncharacterized protein HG535_0A06540 [Zygotorulaspora mrakii]QLG70712.1 hypothetical protein HG535_0A06540 [Zygotorulaspora mrakii]
MTSLNGNTSAIIFTCLAVIMSFLRKYKPFRVWFTSLFETSLSDYFLPSKQIVVSSPTFTLSKTSAHFKEHGNTTLYELIQALTQLQEYLIRGQRQNGVIFNRTRELQPENLMHLRRIKYFSKVDEVNKSIQQNNISVQLVIRYVLERLIENNKNNDMMEHLPDILKTTCADLGFMTSDKGELIPTGDTIILANSPSKQSTVVEALGHLCRDWSSSFECERNPLNDFVHKRLQVSLKPSSDQDTLVIVPGAGVGQLAQSIAHKFPHCKVDSIEWSALMYVFNQFALDHPYDLDISPFSQYYSGHVDPESQTRQVQVNLKDVIRPANLNVLWGDFRQYTTNDKQYKKIFVCTAFFIDTAENLFEYFQAIEEFTNYCDELHWINIGPLKYGTRPLVQFTVSELKDLRRIRGWEDKCEEVVNDYNKKLNGYMTDYESLYQGYYGLLKFHSVFHQKGKESAVNNSN